MLGISYKLHRVETSSDMINSIIEKGVRSFHDSSKVVCYQQGKDLKIKITTLKQDKTNIPLFRVILN